MLWHRLKSMKIRKRIAVILCDADYSFQQRILTGLIQQAYALDYDVAIFTTSMNFDEETDFQTGEYRIFSLINFDMFDAVIYAPCTINKRSMRLKLEKRIAEECRIPVVALESDCPEYTSLNVDDTAAFSSVVDHLIEHHGLTNILCLTGFAGNLQAESRLEGYRRSMARHGLPIPEGYIIYGDFWQAAALDLAQKLADGDIAMPEAVVCVSDFVALTLCNRLIELGIRVPEDIIIMGYDATPDAAENVPSITTYVRPLADMGRNAVLKVHSMLTGEEVAPAEHDIGHLVLAESCGCGEDFEKKFHKRQNDVNNIVNYHNLFKNCHMAESLNSAATLNKCLGKIVTFLYLINDVKDFHLCLCDQWDDFSKNDTNAEAYTNYTETMRLRITCTDNDAAIVDEPFPKRDLLPVFHAERDTPRALYFTPLHFNERCLGYCAVGYWELPRSFDDLYHSWLSNINNALEFVRIRNIFSSMNQRLYMASIRDTLTGIFNRKGFRRYAAECFQKAVSTGKKLLVIAADLDCLKPINDNFGHLEGDNAISVVANALNTCFENDEICARTGGDEFFVIGCADYTDEKLEQYQRYISQFLARYNDSSEKPYKVEASIGYVCRTVTEADDLQELLDEADARMYANKVLRKKNRT